MIHKHSSGIYIKINNIIITTTITTTTTNTDETNQIYL